MTNAIDDAVERLQELSAAMTSLPDGTRVNARSTYPVETSQPYPFSVAYVSGGTWRLTNKTMLHNFPVISVEFHFTRANLSLAYKQINAVVFEFPQRIAGDSTLAANVQTVKAGQDEDSPFVARPFDYGGIKSQMLRFDITLKLLQSPLS